MTTHSSDKTAVLEKAIKLAIEGGWDYRIPEEHLGIAREQVGGSGYLFYWHGPGYEDLIFNHDFAKALWPRTNETCLLSSQLGMRCNHDMCDTAEYKLHLQQMVIADDPIEYLSKALEGKAGEHA